MAGKLNLDPQGIVDKEFDIDFKGYNLKFYSKSAK